MSVSLPEGYITFKEFDNLILGEQAERLTDRFKFTKPEALYLKYLQDIADEKARLEGDDFSTTSALLALQENLKSLSTHKKSVEAKIAHIEDIRRHVYEIIQQSYMMTDAFKICFLSDGGGIRKLKGNVLFTDYAETLHAFLTSRGFVVIDDGDGTEKGIWCISEALAERAATFIQKEMLGSYRSSWDYDPEGDSLFDFAFVDSSLVFPEFGNIEDKTRLTLLEARLYYAQLSHKERIVKTPKEMAKQIFSTLKSKDILSDDDYENMRKNLGKKDYKKFWMPEFIE